MKSLKPISLLASCCLATACMNVRADDVIVTPVFQNAQHWLQKQRLDLTDSQREAFSEGYILVAGQGLPKAGGSPAQQRLTALRAAEVAAYRRLVEIVDGVAVVGQTTVRDCSLADDTVKTAVKGFVRGARKVYEEWNPDEGMATVFMQVGLRGPDSVSEVMYASYLNAPAGRAVLQTASYTPPASHVPTARPAAAEAHDGLIVDVRSHGFRPALINRIFSGKGEALYDPSKVSQKVLVEQGAGEYTNSVEKARAALETRGVKAPLVIKATGLKSPADLNVSDDDAVRIFAADQKGNFLAAAKVAFVLD
jgi:hypothetical protein